MVRSVVERRVVGHDHGAYCRDIEASSIIMRYRIYWKERESRTTVRR